jgi:UTRA domain
VRQIRARSTAGGSFSVILEFRPVQVTKGIRYLALPLICRMQVNHGRPRGAVTHPLHQLAEVRACGSRQDIASMAKIVKVDIRQASSSQRWEPHPTAEDTARAWDMPSGIPLLICRRVSFDADGRTIEISDAEYPADRTELRFITPLEPWPAPPERTN